MATDLEHRVAELERRITALEIRERAVPGDRAGERILDLETTVGLTWLNRAGAALLVVGLALGAGWANERGYLSPVVRNGLVAIASLAVLYLGTRMLVRGDSWHRRFALGVAVVGAFGLYLVPFTASRIDTLLVPAQAAALCIALTVALVVASRLLSVPELASFGLLGGLSIPLAGGAGTASGFGPALVGALYVLVATTDRKPTLPDHVALVIAAAGGGWTAYDTLASPVAPGLVGAIALAAAAGLRTARADRTAVQLLFTVGVVGIGVAWTAISAGLGGVDAPVGISAALVSYGLALVALGVACRSRLCRLLGIGVLVVAAGKLVLRDVWYLPSGLRVATLFVLGLGLLAASFLYSRFAARAP